MPNSRISSKAKAGIRKRNERDVAKENRTRRSKAILSLLDRRSREVDEVVDERQAHRNAVDTLTRIRSVASARDGNVIVAHPTVHRVAQHFYDWPADD